MCMAWEKSRAEGKLGRPGGEVEGGGEGREGLKVTFKLSPEGWVGVYQREVISAHAKVKRMMWRTWVEILEEV